MKLNIVFTGLGITNRNNKYISRSIHSFNNIEKDIIGLPILLDHPTNIDNIKDLLKTDTNFSIIGNIESIYEIKDDCIRVIANILDPYFIEFYESLSEDEKQLIETSPAVESEFINPIEIDNFTVYTENIIRLDHLSILLPEYNMCNGYWSKYINDYMVKDIQHNINKQIDGEIPMITENEATKVLDEATEVTEVKEEIKEDVVVEDKKEEIVTQLEDEIKQVEEDKQELQQLKEEVEVLPEDSIILKDVVVQPEVIEVDKDTEVKVLDEDIIHEDFETQSDLEKEVIVKMVSNLIDSIEGFRKPMFKDRVKASVYLKKTLSLNKQFIDSKYHSVIDSIDETSIEFGKEVLQSIKLPKETKSIGKEYVQVSNNTYVKKFI